MRVRLVCKEWASVVISSAFWRRFCVTNALCGAEGEGGPFDAIASWRLVGTSRKLRAIRLLLCMLEGPTSFPGDRFVRGLAAGRVGDQSKAQLSHPNADISSSGTLDQFLSPFAVGPVTSYRVSAEDWLHADYPWEGMLKSACEEVGLEAWVFCTGEHETIVVNGHCNARVPAFRYRRPPLLITEMAEVLRVHYKQAVHIHPELRLLLCEPEFLFDGKLRVAPEKRKRQTDTAEGAFAGKQPVTAVHCVAKAQLGHGLYLRDLLDRTSYFAVFVARAPRLKFLVAVGGRTCCMLIFESGHIVFTGLPAVEAYRDIFAHIEAEITEFKLDTGYIQGPHADEPGNRLPVTVKHLVAEAALGTVVSLDTFHLQWFKYPRDKSPLDPEEIDPLDPEEIDHLTLREADWKAALFKTGRLIFMGQPDLETYCAALCRIEDELAKLD